jgi:hypothetical protein
MILSKRSLLVVSSLGLFTSLSLAAGCSPTGTGDGDGDTGSTTGSGGSTTGSGGSITGSGGGEAGPSFCAPATTCPPVVNAADLPANVSFKTQVYPILTASCSGGLACHGAAATAGLNFGTVAAPLDDPGLTALVTQLTTTNSELTPTKLVVASDWQHSFMMMKVDGCQNSMGLSCTVPADSVNSIACYESDTMPNNCGDGMPQAEDSVNNPDFPISDADRNIIRAWIAQGAMNN